MSRAVEVTEAEARRLFDSGHLVSAQCGNSYTRQLFASAAAPLYGFTSLDDMVSHAVATHRTGSEVTYYRRVGITTNGDVAGAILRREGDAHNARRSLTTEWHPWETSPLRSPSMGDLPYDPWQLALHKAWERSVARKKDLYIVRSYGTPIAWVEVEGNVITMPPLRYSQTTTGHQHVVANGLGIGPWNSFDTKRAHPERRNGHTPYTRSWQSKQYG